MLPMLFIACQKETVDETIVNLKKDAPELLEAKKNQEQTIIDVSKIDFTETKYDEARKVFKNMLHSENQVLFIINVKDEVSWKEYLFYKYATTFVNEFTETNNQLRYHKDSKTIYLANSQTNQINTDIDYQESLQERANCAWVCNDCPADGTCLYMWVHQCRCCVYQCCHNEE